jgi:hypothetical protein
MFTLSPRTMAQTADTQCASNVPSSQVCGYANASSVAISSENESGATTPAESNQTDWVHAWMCKVDEGPGKPATFCLTDRHNARNVGSDCNL